MTSCLPGVLESEPVTWPGSSREPKNVNGESQTQGRGHLARGSELLLYPVGRCWFSPRPAQWEEPGQSEC